MASISNNKWLWFFISLIVILIFYYLFNLIVYFVLASIIAFITRPLTEFLAQNKIFKGKISNSLASILSLFTFSFSVFLVFYFVFPVFVNQITLLSQINYNQLILNLENYFSEDVALLKKMGVWPSNVQLQEWLETFFKKFSFSQFSSYFGSILGFTLNILASIFSVLFISFYLIRDAKLVENIIYSLTPDSKTTQMQSVLHNTRILLSRYFSGLILQVTIVTIVVSSGLSIFGVKNALVLGILAGLFNLIPYIGPFIGAAFGIFIGFTSALASPESIHLGIYILKISSVFLFVQLLDNFVLQPLIFSKSVKAHPLEIFFVVLIAANIFGIVGMIAAIPVYTIGRVLAREFFSHIKAVKNLTEKM
jgi:predicted PurR-regulated permease PerM